MPQSQSEIIPLSDSRIVAGIGGPELRALAVVVILDGVLQATVRIGKSALIEGSCALHEKRFHQHAGIVRPLGEFRSVGSEGQGPLQFAADQAPFPQTQQNSELLLRIPKTCARSRACCNVGPTSGAA